MIPLVIATSLSGALLLGIVGAALKHTRVSLSPLRWVRICACGHPRYVHRYHRRIDCWQCPCTQWRPFWVRRHRVQGEPEPLPQRRKPVPGLPGDGKPLDQYELEQLSRVIDPDIPVDSKGSNS